MYFVTCVVPRLMEATATSGQSLMASKGGFEIPFVVVF